MRLVVIGNGMAGARFVEDLLRRGGGERYAITVFGDEPYGNYNRILLSSVLAGDHTADDIVINPCEWYAEQGVLLRAGERIHAIDLTARHVVAADRSITRFDVLVIATGSRPFIPAIAGLMGADGRMTAGAFAFRTVHDCEQIVARAGRANRAVVIGGGLLGLEAARGLLGRGLEVDVVHLTNHVMETQLDADGSRLLRQQLEQLGLRVHVNKATKAILGGDRVKAVVFADGGVLECDMVVIAAGILPNTALASAAGLAVGRGILVDDGLACRDADGVYAIGECAEHRGQIYGLVAPLWEQAQVLADRLSGRHPDARYCGSQVSTRLKVAGVDLAVMGVRDAEEGDEVVTYIEPSRCIYKKLIVRDDRLAGAIVMGDGAIVPSLLQAFGEGTRLSANRSELLFPAASETAPASVDRLPDAARICDCNAITKGRILEAALEGACTVGAIGERTRAGTGCGSCRPEIQALLDHVRRELDARAASEPRLVVQPV
jgi:nitrite reductase (NADH) large subunit